MVPALGCFRRYYRLNEGCFVTGVSMKPSSTGNKSSELLRSPTPLKRVKFTPQFMGSPKMALFIAERAYDLFLAPAPDGICACLSGIAVWTSTPLDTPGPVVPLSAAR
jgi:hypothetical protein